MTEPHSPHETAEAIQQKESGAESDLRGEGPKSGDATEGGSESQKAPTYTFEDYLRDCLGAGRGGRKEDLERALRTRPTGDRLVPAQIDSLLLAFQESDPELRVLLDIGVQLTNVERGGPARMSFSGLAWAILRARPTLGGYLADFEHLVDLQDGDLRSFFSGFAKAQESAREDSPPADEDRGKADKKNVLKNEAAVAGLCMALADIPMTSIVMGMARAATAGSRPRPPGEGITAAAEWLQGKKIPRQLIGILEQLQASRDRQAERDRTEREVLQRRLDELAAHVAQLQREIAELASARDQLTAELDEERRRAKDQAIGLRHNLYSVTHAVLRALEDEVSPRLQESLKALSRDPPKTAVAIEYTGKAVDIVEEQIGCLKS